MIRHPLPTALILGLGVLAAPGTAAPIVVPNVDEYRVMDPNFECVRIALAQRGDSYSPEYIQGVSGSAFRIGGICPCAPTSCHAQGTGDLLTMLGYEYEWLNLAESEDMEADVGPVIERVKREIDAGRAVIVWHAFTSAEWDVVCGYDDDTGDFLGYGSYAGADEFARAPQRRMLEAKDLCPVYGALIVGERVRQPDLVQLERAALADAVRHAHSESKQPMGSEQWLFLNGLACYDRWISAFRDDPAYVQGNGDIYCLGVYRSTHRSAASFLREIAPRHVAASDQLLSAAAHFDAEADALDPLCRIIGWDSPREADAARNIIVAEHLRRARDGYAAGIREVLRALEVLGLE